MTAVKDWLKPRWPPIDCSEVDSCRHDGQQFNVRLCNKMNLAAGAAFGSKLIHIPNITLLINPKEML